MKQNFEACLAGYQTAIEEYLSQIFKLDTPYANIQQAMEYSLLAGGKRIRPILTLASCCMCGGQAEQALPFAAAVEMIHTYSLIHDDLPAMDNDQLRRGKPTNHVVYGEATAILAGDGLLTAAFAQLACAKLPPERVVQAVACLSAAAGHTGMVGGQALDMAGEGQGLRRKELELLQSLKTGALITAAAQLGCIAAGGSQAQREKLSLYAQSLGCAFQVRDDMLDVISCEQELGKSVGSDRVNEKSTFFTALGLDGCTQLVEQLTDQAVQALDGFDHPEFHIWLASQMATRSK